MNNHHTTPRSPPERLGQKLRAAGKFPRGVVRAIIAPARSDRSVTIGDIYKIFIAALALFFLTGDRLEKIQKWFDWDKCRGFEPASGASAKRNQLHSCRPGRIAYVQWMDPKRHDDNNYFVLDQPNRVLQLDQDNGSGPLSWSELTLYRDDAGTPKWEPNARMRWVLVPGGEAVPKWSAVAGEQIDNANTLDRETGFVLRRIAVADDSCEMSDQKSPKMVKVLEFLIENKASFKKYDAQHPGVYLRWIEIQCGTELGSSLRIGGRFQPFLPIIRARSDPESHILYEAYRVISRRGADSLLGN
jgi:hypothetical protein